MHALGRLSNLTGWLRRAPPGAWRIRRADCPACGGRYAFTMDGSPARSRCLSCRLTGSAMALLPVLGEHIARRGLTHGLAWEMSTHGPVRPYLARHGIETVETEFFPGTPSGTVVNGTRCEDVTAPSFAEASLDLITCNQVFEHVEEDRRGYAECHRILKPGGALVFMVPLGSRGQTTKIADSVDGEVIFRGMPEYHGSRLTGPASVPVFWHFKRGDLPARVADAGFEVEWRHVSYVPDARITGGPQARFASSVLYAVKR